MNIKKSLYALLSIALVIAIYYFVYWYFFVKKDGFSNVPTFYLAYASWCPHCKNVKPIFEDWSKSGSTTVNGKTVNLVMVESEDPKMKNLPVKGYPTLLLENNGKFTECDSDRSVSGWESWLESKL